MMATSAPLVKGVAWPHKKTCRWVSLIKILSVAINMYLALSVATTMLNADTSDFSMDTMSSCFNKPTNAWKTSLHIHCGAIILNVL